MKFLILTTKKSTLTWDKLPHYLAEIKSALNAGQHADWTVEIEYKAAIPKVVNNRIDHAWLLNLFKPYYSAGYDCVALHLSRREWVVYKIQATARGMNPITHDEFGDFYFFSDEDTSRKGLPQFVQTCLHEFSHEYYSDVKHPDQTHPYHDAHTDISPLFKTFDWSLFQGKRQELVKKLSLLQSLLKLLQKQQQLPKLDLQPLVQRQAKAIIDDMAMLGHEVRITEGYRTKERQTALYTQGRTTPGKIVTNAKAGESLHNYGVAVDFVFRKEGYDASKELWETLGVIGERNGFDWGGRWDNFIDRPHFELKLGYSLSDFTANRIDWKKYV